MSVKRTCDPDRWNPSTGRATGSRESVKSINAYLDSYQSRVYQAKRKLVEGGHVITASAIKDGLSGRDQIGKMLIKIFEDYNNKVESLIRIDYSESTWTKYDRTRRLTKEFVKWKYDVDDIHIRQVDLAFASEMEVWFKTIRKCGHNSTAKYLSILKMIILYCRDNQSLASY